MNVRHTLRNVSMDLLRLANEVYKGETINGFDLVTLSKRVEAQAEALEMELYGEADVAKETSNV